jgi:hypothetical protein
VGKYNPYPERSTCAFDTDFCKVGYYAANYADLAFANTQCQPCPKDHFYKMDRSHTSPAAGRWFDSETYGELLLDRTARCARGMKNAIEIHAWCWWVEAQSACMRSNSMPLGCPPAHRYVHKSCGNAEGPNTTKTNRLLCVNRAKLGTLPNSHAEKGPKSTACHKLDVRITPSTHRVWLEIPPPRITNGVHGARFVRELFSA